MKRHLCTLILAFIAMPAGAVAFSDLYSQVPTPPDSTFLARNWMTREQIVFPDYVRLKQSLDAERAGITALNGGTFPQIAPSPALDASERPEVRLAWKSYKDRKSTRLNSSHNPATRMPSSA
jgi:hypothetical protein